eukprot:TRINITY_DN11287_c0_g1_i1.p3 TRINITY_DN11287_c0_g1~~TRINITY_DN11287_c0_g1_i1.p3  ORF type:complete len:134 (+),score=36.87 TRINITY_DN11287_c0_g1_i1:57-458(+)
MARLASSASLLALRRWAVIGDVLNPSKPASWVVSRLRHHNKEVHLANPRAEKGALPQSLAEVLTEVPDLEVVDLVVNPREGLRQLRALPPDTPLHVFVQPGAESAKIREECEARRWPFFEGCVLVEMPASARL